MEIETSEKHDKLTGYTHSETQQSRKVATTAAAAVATHNGVTIVVATAV